MENIKKYLEKLTKAELDETPFPVDLDQVWDLAYSDKYQASRALKESGNFVEGEHYFIGETPPQNMDFSNNSLHFSNEVFRKNAENPTKKNPKIYEKSTNLGGRPSEKVWLSISCFEFFIVSKNPQIFEVYRQVFKAFRHWYKNYFSQKPVLLTSQKEVRKNINKQKKVLAMTEVGKEWLSLRTERQIYNGQAIEIQREFRKNHNQYPLFDDFVQKELQRFHTLNLQIGQLDERISPLEVQINQIPEGIKLIELEAEKKRISQALKELEKYTFRNKKENALTI